jgi:NADP-dependent 3-hydroxy acid dehydrogenase YdfG
MSLFENRIQGKTVLLTGGSSGIGAAIARKLHQAGAQVAITGRHQEKLNAVNHEAQGKLLTFVCDGTQVEQVKQTVAEVEKLFGRIDILVNNAGMNVKNRYASNLTPEDWQKTIQVNLDAAFFFVHAVLPGMVRRQHGHLIITSSISGLRANKLGGTAYAASKFGVTALSLSVGLEEAEHGIRTTAICPGEVDTPILDQRPAPVSDERRAVILRPEDVAEAVLYVANLREGVSVPELVITPTVQPFA